MDEHTRGDRTRGVDPADGPVAREKEALVGRKAELERLFRMANVVNGASATDRVLVLRGDAGMGKSALLDSAMRWARVSGVRVLRAEGSESEASLAYSGLHQLVRPVAAAVDGLPERQRTALAGALGTGPAAEGAPDLMLIGVALLSLLSESADPQPLMLVIDDAQWIDRASLDALAFAVKRLEAEPVTLLIGVRTGDPLPALDRHWPTLTLAPLDAAAAGRLLDHQPQSPTGRVRGQVIEQAAGNPLALVELARAAATSPGNSPNGPLPLTGELERIFATRLAELPAPSVQLLLLLAAMDTADSAALAAAGLPGAEHTAWRPALQAGLVRSTGGAAHFAHPLMRSAVYHAASPDARRAAHLALADLLGDAPDRRAWHRAAAAPGPDAGVAAALAQTADRARRRGGHAAAAQALQRAADLAPDRAESARLLVEAATAAVFIGDITWVDELATTARERTDDATLLANAAVHSGRLAALTTGHAVVFSRLTRAARQWTATDPDAALDLLAGAAVVRFYSGEDTQRQEIDRVLAQLPQDEPSAWLRAWVRAVSDPTDGRAELVALLPQLLADAEGAPERLTTLAIMAWLLDETALAVSAFDTAFDGWRAHGPLPEGLGGAAAWAYVEYGRWEQAREACAQITASASALGLDHAVACATAVDACVLAFQGEAARARSRAAEALALIDPLESRSVAVYVRRALGAAAGAEGAYETAYDQLRLAFTAEGDPVHYHASWPALAELAAAAVRSGHRDEASSIVERAARRLGDSASPRRSALISRARALLADPEEAERHFRAALADPALERRPFEHAQTLLDHAEWLRRRRRITEARPLLTTALETFQRLGARPWVERAQAESRAAGLDVAASTTPDALAELSPQQRQIIGLAARGLTNREIGEKLFLSPRTVGSHLYRSFPKLGVTARSQLRDLVEGTPLVATAGKQE
ncbi:AAA family ATPase [Streptomyces sp. NPDC102381]|uniref:helix-turn-helix transcriptional regulator n=1 Tax=Streptomyces sp. NPDC102381 TaxID=3366164 RepID=UPI003826F9F4